MSTPNTGVAIPALGTLPAMITPFDSDEAVDHASISTLVEWMIKHGVDGLVPCGTTGEFASLSREERRSVIETTAGAADGDAPIIAGAAATTVGSTLEHINDAAAAGADAVLITPPYYHAANASTGNLRFFERVADESVLPIYLYNIPMCTSGPIHTETVRKLATNDCVHGIKDTSGDFSVIQRFIAETPDSFHVFQGYDDHFVAAQLLGASGGINALAGVFPEAFEALSDALEVGDTARAKEIQQRIVSPLFELSLEYGFAPTIKTALQSRGLLENATVRPPLIELDDAQRTDVSTAVENACSYLE